MGFVISTLDEDTEIWQNPEDKYDVFTVGQIFEYHEMKNIILEFLAEIAEGDKPDLDQFYDQCEAMGISPNSCPLCGRFKAHAHHDV